MPGHKRTRWVVLAVVALLALARWCAMSSPDHFAWLPVAWFQGEVRSLTQAVLNVVCSWGLLVFLPLAILTLRGKNSPQLWGLGRPRFPSKAWLLLAGLLPFGAALLGLLAAQYVPGVREAYPVYRAAGQNVSSVVLSSAMTLALILATELFYRGAALFSLEQGFGRWAVYLLLPVYALDHLGAPTAELAGSVVAGALLGHLALAGRSIWPGFMIHACCALAVDLASMVLRQPVL